MQANKIVYLYNEDLTNFEFSKDHFMKPRRIKMAHSLVKTFGLNPYLTIINSRQSTPQQMEAFHHPQYVKYLQTWVIPDRPTTKEYNDAVSKAKFVQDAAIGAIFKVNQILDCPGFEGLFYFCQLAAGSSLDAADAVICGLGDTVVNWSGGYHHAKKSQASGFCYVNDIVLCILELLKMYNRVLYLDIDVHHGDGVEEAFYNTNRVMTVSFHQHQPGFFPQSGSLQSVGQGIGKYFSVNVPLKRGIDDVSYYQLFKTIIDRVMGSYRPDVVVVQCGADSLSKDRLGALNLSIRGHAACLAYMKRFGTPMIVLGGGGYTIENVARCWAYQTGQLVGTQIGNEIPSTDDFYYYYGRDNFKVHFDIEQKQNENSPSYLNSLIMRVTENLRASEMRPSVQFHEAPKVIERERMERNTQVGKELGLKKSRPIRKL